MAASQVGGPATIQYLPQRLLGTVNSLPYLTMPVARASLAVPTIFGVLNWRGRPQFGWESVLAGGAPIGGGPLGRVAIESLTILPTKFGYLLHGFILNDVSSARLTACMVLPMPVLGWLQLMGIPTQRLLICLMTLVT